MRTQENIFAELKSDVTSQEIVLFAKGNKLQPRCGFSAATIMILNTFKKDYTVIDVLADPEKKEALKEFSHWPTIPQLYVKGNLVGGCDIVKEMYENGDLAKLLG